MGATSASRTAAVFARRALATSAAAAAALLALAIPASAHTPEAKASCNEETAKTKLEVKASNYNAGGSNTIKITDGDAVVIDTTTFGRQFPSRGGWFVKDDFDGTVEHDFVVDVKAFNDPEGQYGWTKTVRVHVDACVEEEQPPETTTTTATTTTTTTTTLLSPVFETTTVPPTTTTTLAIGANANLAETGASIALPLGIGALLLVGGGVMLLVMRKRKA